MSLRNVVIPKWWKPHKGRFDENWFAWRGDDRRYYAALHGSKPYIIVNRPTVEELINEVRAHKPGKQP